jgi:prepilin-type N-terminal cleavage/methylation domain-containing protein
MTEPRRDQRGLTLTEVAVVMILGSLIMAGLVGFYLSSQGLWLDGSTQAITQREASLVASAIRDSVRRSGRAKATESPDQQHMQLALFKSADEANDLTPYYYFYWNSADSLIHAGPTVAGPGAGPIGSSRATRLLFVASNDGVRMDLRLLTATGNRVDMGAFAVFKN